MASSTPRKQMLCCTCFRCRLEAPRCPCLRCGLGTAAPFYEFPHRTFPRPRAGGGLVGWFGAAGLLVGTDVIHPHLGGEARAAIRVAEEAAADGNIHDQVEWPIERGRPRVEVGLACGPGAFLAVTLAAAPPEALRI